MKKKHVKNSSKQDEAVNYKKINTHHKRGIFFISAFVVVFCIVLGCVGKEMQETLRENQAVVEELQMQIDEQKEKNWLVKNWVYRMKMTLFLKKKNK